MKNLEKFLEFNGKRIMVLSADGTWWVAVKPICEALNVDYIRAFKNLKEDEFFIDALSKQTTRDSLNRVAEMTCIKEHDVYGWISTLRSDSPELAKYKRTCYDILYNHFHGTMTARKTILSEQDSISEEISQLEESLLETEQYKKIQELKKRRGDTTKELKRLDIELKSGQLLFSFS